MLSPFPQSSPVGRATLDSQSPAVFIAFLPHTHVCWEGFDLGVVGRGNRGAKRRAAGGSFTATAGYSLTLPFPVFYKVHLELCSQGSLAPVPGMMGAGVGSSREGCPSSGIMPRVPPSSSTPVGNRARKEVYPDHFLAAWETAERMPSFTVIRLRQRKRFPASPVCRHGAGPVFGATSLLV